MDLNFHASVITLACFLNSVYKVKTNSLYQCGYNIKLLHQLKTIIIKPMFNKGRILKEATLKLL